MKQLTCEMCGSTDLIKQDGVFVCQSCGTKYTVEEAKKMMVEGTVEVTGTVRVDTTSFSDSYAKRADIARQTRQFREADYYYTKALEMDPENWELYWNRFLSSKGIKDEDELLSYGATALDLIAGNLKGDYYSSAEARAKEKKRHLNEISVEIKTVWDDAHFTDWSEEDYIGSRVYRGLGYSLDYDEDYKLAVSLADETHRAKLIRINQELSRKREELIRNHEPNAYFDPPDYKVILSGNLKHLVDRVIQGAEETGLNYIDSLLRRMFPKEPYKTHKLIRYLDAVGLIGLEHNLRTIAISKEFWESACRPDDTAELLYNGENNALITNGVVWTGVPVETYSCDPQLLSEITAPTKTGERQRPVAKNKNWKFQIILGMIMLCGGLGMLIFAVYDYITQPWPNRTLIAMGVMWFVAAAILTIVGFWNKKKANR